MRQKRGRERERNTEKRERERERERERVDGMLNVEYKSFGLKRAYISIVFTYENGLLRLMLPTFFFCPGNPTSGNRRIHFIILLII